jgi:hypothetical protein
MFRLFAVTSTLHELCTQQMRRAAVASAAPTGSVTFLERDSIWTAIQVVLVRLLNDYLAISPAASSYLLKKQIRQTEQQATG